jgi:hypothetical protein
MYSDTSVAMLNTQYRMNEVIFTLDTGGEYQTVGKDQIERRDRKTKLETREEDAKLHSKRGGKMQNYTGNE